MTWRCQAVIHWAWAWLVWLPSVRSAGLVLEKKAMLPASSSIVIVCSNTVFKASVWRQNEVKEEFDRYENALRVWPVLSNVLVPLNLLKVAAGTCLRMERYCSSPADKVIEYAIELKSILQSCRVEANSQFKSVDSPELLAGLDAIGRLFGYDSRTAFDRRLNSYLRAASFDLGFAHGDFHSRNIMIDSANKPRLIDLDCIRLCGIQQLDALNFAIEFEWSRSGVMWFNQLTGLLGDRDFPEVRANLAQFGVDLNGGLVLAYMLDRLGQESKRYGFEYLSNELAEAVLTLERSFA